MSSALALVVQHPVLAAVARLHAELDALVEAATAGRVEGLPDEDLVEVMVDLHRVADRATAVASGVTYAVEARGAGRSAGFVSVKRLLEVRAGKAPGSAARTVATATALRRDYPATGAAWLAGQISGDAACTITRTIDTALRATPTERVFDERARLEGAGLVAARTATVADVQRAVAAMRVVVHPDEVDASVLAARESQFLRFTPVPDGVEVCGFLSTETAATVLTALDQRVDHYHRTGQLSTADTRTLTSPTPAARRRLREHLNVDALTDLVRHLLDGALLGTKHEQRPHVRVIVHSDDHAAGLGASLLLPGYGDVRIGSTTASRILCDADITPVLTTRDPITTSDPGHDPADDPALRDPALLDPRDTHLYAPWLPTPTLTLVETNPPPPPSPPLPPPDRDRSDKEWITAIITGNARRVIDVGRSSRTAPPRLRAALEVRDLTCRFPTCTTDSSRTEAHHVTHWEHGGETTLANMLLLCSRHHHLVHEGRWTISTDPHLHPGDPAHFRFIPPRPRTRRSA